MVTQLRARLVAISWRDLAITLGPILLLSLAGIWFAIRFVRPAPPDSITITTGADGSTFRIAADKYRNILARNGITLKILSSQGALENLKRLNDPSFQVDVGFVQGGVAGGVRVDGLVKAIGNRCGRERHARPGIDSSQCKRNRVRRQNGPARS